MTDQPQPELTCDFQNAFPDGTRDTSSYDDIETALDRADAPIMDGKMWLKLPERISALAAERTAASLEISRLRAALEQIFAVGDGYGPNTAGKPCGTTGDGHARCREIARDALRMAQK